MTTLISLKQREARLRTLLEEHLQSLGFTKSNDGAIRPPDHEKDTFRNFHQMQRRHKLFKSKLFLEEKTQALLPFFAEGYQINPDRIRPRLEEIKGRTWQSDLFRFAALYWRVPVSDGYGRRLRFLVWDEQNDKLIGLLALGDAVFNLKARDELIGWDHRARSKKLINIMDAYVLGAVPPYNTLLCGKLIACLVRSQQVINAFHRKYYNSVGIISGKRKRANLVMVTTSSALGKSSIYNRLKLGEKMYMKSIGFTSGWGHFHVPDDLFLKMRDYLSCLQDKYAGNYKFGQGPNWRLRAIRKVLSKLGMSENLMQHGFTREVFASFLAENALHFLKGDEEEPDYSDLLTTDQISELALDRWIIPRSFRRKEFMNWKREEFLSSIYQMS